MILIYLGTHKTQNFLYIYKKSTKKLPHPSIIILARPVQIYVINNLRNSRIGQSTVVNNSNETKL